MPEPVNPANKQTWTDTATWAAQLMFNVVHKTIPIVWGTWDLGSKGIQHTSDLLAPEGAAAKYWTSCSERTKRISNAAAPLIVWAATAMAMSYMMGSGTTTSIPHAAVLANAMTVVTAGFVAKAYSERQLGRTPADSFTRGMIAAYATGNLVMNIATPGMLGVGLAGTVVANSAASAVILREQVIEYWNSCSDDTKKIAKAVAYALALVAITGAWSYSRGEETLASIPCAVGLASASIGTTTALVTAAFSRYQLETSFKSAGIAGVVAGMGAGKLVMNLASPAGVGVMLLGAIVGSLGGGAVALSHYPGQIFPFVIPMVKEELFLEATDIHAPPATPVTNPAISLKPLTSKIAEFNANYPEALHFTDPHLVIIDRMEKTHVGSMSVLLKAQRALEELELTRKSKKHAPVSKGENREVGEEISLDQQKINAVSQVLIDAKFPIRLEDLDIYLIKKIEAIPFDSDNYVKAKEKTDEQLALLVKNGSLLGTIFGIHIQAAGQENTDKVYEAMKQIAKEAAKPNARDLWDIYDTHLGNKLKWWPKFNAKIAYWLLHGLGIIKKPAQEFLTNVINATRSTVDPKNESKLKNVFNEAFKEINNFLDLYNGAAEAFANDPKGGSLLSYQKRLIAESGGSLLLKEVVSKLKPGEDLGQKMMEALCKKFSDVLIDDCLPPIKILEDSKKLPVIGYLVWAFAWVCEFIINTVVEYQVRKYLPDGIQTLVKVGLDNTSATQYPYKIQIANTLTELIESFHLDLKNGVTTKPHRLDESAEINGVAKRIVKTLKLKHLGSAPVKEDVKAFLDELKQHKSTEMDTDAILEKLISEGTNELVYNYSHKPENMEELIGKLFRVTNNLFEPGATIQTKDDYKLAFKRLKGATQEVVKASIEGVIQDQLQTTSVKKFDEALEGSLEDPGIYKVQMANGARDFQRLDQICQSMSARLDSGHPEDGVKMLRDLDNYVQTLTRFVADAEGLNVHLYPQRVAYAFNRAFHPIYVEAATLGQKAVDLKKRQLKYEKLMNIAHGLTEIGQIAQQGNPSTAVLEKKLRELEEIEAKFEECQVAIPELAEKITLLRKRIENMKSANIEAEKVLDTLRKMGKLPTPETLGDHILNDPTTWLAKIMNAVPPVDQVALINAIDALQAAHQRNQSADLALLKKEIATLMTSIFQKQVESKQEKLAQVTDYLAEFRLATQAVHGEFSAKREALKLAIKDDLLALKAKTTKISDNLKKAKLPPFTLFKRMSPLLIGDVYTLIGKPREEEIIGDDSGKKAQADNYLDAAFNLLTDSDIYQGFVRILMGRVIEDH